MQRLRLSRPLIGVLAFIVPLVLLLAYVAIRSGPLSPVQVTVTHVTIKSIQPSLFGIGTVDARYSYKIGPTFAGRLSRLDAQVGDRVEVGQVLGEMDSVDLDDRISAQKAAIQGAKAALEQAKSKLSYAKTEADRYQKLSSSNSVSKTAIDAKLQELDIARASLQSAVATLNRTEAEQQALLAQRYNLQLVSPVAGLVVARNADPGTTVVGGQSVVELIDPNSIWINTRFDQHSAEGLRSELSANIRLRSRSNQTVLGKIVRVEPLADVVTEEILTKVVFDELPNPLPPIGELAEVTVDLPALPPSVVVPNAAIKVVNGQRGVWKVINAKPVFHAVVLGRQGLNGDIQIIKGLSEDDSIIVYSEKPVFSHSRLRIVTSLTSEANHD